MRVLKVSTARTIAVFMTDSADHITGKTGLTLTITASKDGNGFVGITPTVVELGNGWYSLALTATHTNLYGDLALHITAPGADPTDLLMQVVGYDFNDVASLGLSRLDAAVSTRLASATYTAPANADIAAVKAKTDNLPADPASNTQVNTRLASASYTAPTAPDNAGIAAIKLKTDNLPASPAATSDIPAANITAIKAKTDLIPSSPASELTVNAVGVLATAIKAKTDNLPADPASNTQVNTRLATASYTAPSVPPSAASIASAVLNEDVSAHTTPGSFGEWINSKMLTVNKFLGLK